MFEQIVYAGANSLRGLSYGLWKDCPDRVRFDPNAGIFDMEDFNNVPIPLPSNTNNLGWGRHKGFSSISTSPAPMLYSNTSEGGLIQLEVDGDNEAVVVGQGNLPFMLAIGKGNFWWETRLVFSSILTGEFGAFAGLIDNTTWTATLPMADDGTLGDANFVGFHRREATDMAFVNTVYKANGVTQVTVKSQANPIVAGTAIKLGMKVKQRSGSAARLEYFVNGVALPDYKDLPAAAGTDFPNDVTMGWVLAYKAAKATPLVNFQADWIAYGYQFQSDVSA